MFGSPTYNSGILGSMSAILEELKGLRLKDKKAAAFGAYGWAAASVKILNKLLEESGFELAEQTGITANWNPNEDELAKCVDLGKKFAEICK